MGKYELIRRLATGGMAEVFLAKAAGPMGFEKTLVVKRILPHLVEDPRFVEMFLSEAKLAAQLNHPNVVQIFDFGEAEGAYFIAMEYIDGPNLRTLSLRAHELGTPVPFSIGAKIISYACEGLAYAHDYVDPNTGEPLQLIHRDISPDNIIIARNGAVKVVDFGIAKAATQLHHTKTGLLKGKLAYMAPEQLKGKPLDRRADIFALGVVLYELASAKKPYDAESEITMMHAILYEPMVPVRQRRPDIPKDLERIIEKALSREREERYPTCRELQADLERFVMTSGEPIGAYQISQTVSKLGVEPIGSSAHGTPPPGISTPGDRGTPKPIPLTAPLDTSASSPSANNPAHLLTESLLANSLLSGAEPSTTQPMDARGSDKVVVSMPEVEADDDDALPRDELTIRDDSLLEELRRKDAEEEARQKEAARLPTLNEDDGEDDPTVEARPKPRVSGQSQKMPAAREPAPSQKMPAARPNGQSQKMPAAKESQKIPAAKDAVKRPSQAMRPVKKPAPPPEERLKAPRAWGPVIGVALVGLALIIGGIGYVTSRKPDEPEKKPEVVENTQPPAESNTHAQPADPPPAHQAETDAKPPPDEPAEAPPEEAPQAVSLTVTSEPAAQVRISSKGLKPFTGKSPLTAEVPAGRVDVEVYDKAAGFSKRQSFTLKAGGPVKKTISIGKGMLDIRSVPWANVTLDGKPLGQTPLKPTEAYEGKHTIKFECPNLKKENSQEVVLQPGETKVIKAQYN